MNGQPQKPSSRFFIRGRLWHDRIWLHSSGHLRAPFSHILTARPKRPIIGTLVYLHTGGGIFPEFAEFAAKIHQLGFVHVWRSIHSICLWFTACHYLLLFSPMAGSSKSLLELDLRRVGSIGRDRASAGHVVSVALLRS